MDEDLREFKNKIFKYALFAAVLAELISLPFLGLELKFSYGLAVGTAVAIVNFSIMEAVLKHAVRSASGASVILMGYLVRLAFYGISFYICIKTSYPCGAGAAAGFLTVKIAIYYLHGFRAKFSKNRTLRQEPEELNFKKHWYDFKEVEDDEENDDWDYKNRKKKED